MVAVIADDTLPYTLILVEVIVIVNGYTTLPRKIE